MISTLSRRAPFANSAAFATIGAIPAAVACVHASPDAELIRVCDQHIANHAAFNASSGILEPEDDPLWHAYMQTYDAISAGKPQTLAALAAKARAAKVEASLPNGGELMHGGEAAEWSRELVHDLLRLQGSPKHERPTQETKRRSALDHRSLIVIERERRRHRRRGVLALETALQKLSRER